MAGGFLERQKTPSRPVQGSRRIPAEGLGPARRFVDLDNQHLGEEARPNERACRRLQPRLEVPRQLIEIEFGQR
jgi:hypothetical protein